MGLSPKFKRFRTFRATQLFSSRVILVLADAGQQVSGRDNGDTAPRQPRSLASTSQQSSPLPPSPPSPAFHRILSHSQACGVIEGTGFDWLSEFPESTSRSERQKQFPGFTLETRCDEAVVNTSDLNSSATGMKLRMPHR